MPDATRGRSAASGSRVYPQLADPEWLRAAYLDEHLSMLQIAERVGCTQQAARMALVNHEIPIRPAVRASVLGDLSAEDALDMVREHGLGGGASALGVAPVTFAARLNALRVLGEARALSRERVGRVSSERARRALRAKRAHWPAQLWDREWLHDNYQRMHLTELAAEVGVSADTVTSALIWHGIPRRRGNERPPLALRHRVPAPEGELVCLVPGCPAAAESRGLCDLDWKLWRRGNLPPGVEPLPAGYQRRLRQGTAERGDCLHPGCLRTPGPSGYCRRHRQPKEPGNPEKPRGNPERLASVNARRSRDAAARTVTAARQRLAAATDPAHRTILTARVEHPDATLAELAALLGMSKDAYTGRLRRALRA